MTKQKQIEPRVYDRSKLAPGDKIVQQFNARTGKLVMEHVVDSGFYRRLARVASGSSRSVRKTLESGGTVSTLSNDYRMAK